MGTLKVYFDCRYKNEIPKNIYQLEIKENTNNEIRPELFKHLYVFGYREAMTKKDWRAKRKHIRAFINNSYYKLSKDYREFFRNDIKGLLDHMYIFYVMPIEPKFDRVYIEKINSFVSGYLKSKR